MGWHVAHRLAEAGVRVRALTRGRNPVRELPERYSGFEVVTGDLQDAASLERAVAGCGMVYHVAADYRLWSREPEELYRSNVEGTRNLLAAARRAGVERVVYTSTVGCIQFVENGLGHEGLPVRVEDMTGHYKRSKFLAERVALEFAGEGFPVVIVNPTAPVGDHDFKPTPTGQTLVEFLSGRMPAYLDTGLNVVDVRDVAQGHLLAGERGRVGERYILGSENLTLREIFAALGEPPKFQVPYGVAYAAALVSTGWAYVSGTVPRAPLEGVKMARKKMWVTHAKAAAELGYAPAAARVGLERAAEWFRANGYIR